MLHNAIKTQREKHSLTQEELAQAVGVSRQTIIAMEKGNYEPSLLLALRISQYFRIAVERLFWIHS